jgi:hypothetical protein
MDEETLHQSFAKVVDASFDFTMAFNTFGEDSEEAHAAMEAYEKAMADYQQEMSRPFDVSTHWASFCALHPGALECRIYDV